ncbi:hypothetical protein [Pseudomonas defluvii]|uniref:hypothetical protein n=1 Tax=Pseudomonas defluvii TaxID=1876757 RepID=UPI003906CFD6
MTAECTVYAYQHQVCGLAMTQSAVQHREQEAGVEYPGECVATSCWSVHILCSEATAVDEGGKAQV